MTYYVGILDGSGDVWGVRIPDLPGANGGGDTPEDAIASAIEGAREWADSMTRRGHAIPAARTVEAVLRSGEVEQGEAMVMIPLRGA